MMANFFETDFGSIYLRIPVPETETAEEIVCCVDISGSMSGSAINNVSSVLRDVYELHKTDYRILCYNSVVQEMRLSELVTTGLTARGGTSFKAVFDKVCEYVVSATGNTSFIFMTDGQDTVSRPDQLTASINKLKLFASNSHHKIRFHVIGFGGDVKADFLERVRTFGNHEGSFKYSTGSAELQADFREMFEFASANQDYQIAAGGRKISCQGGNGCINLLVSMDEWDPAIDHLTVTADHLDEPLVIPCTRFEKVTPVQQINAINLVTPTDEAGVRGLLVALNGINPTGVSLTDRLQVEQMKKEINERLMEYLSLFTQMKMGQVDERVKLKLNALRHTAQFANLRRKKKLEMRVNKNVEYFKKTDINGILKGFVEEMTPEAWAEINSLRNKWECAYSRNNFYELMKSSHDEILCLGLLVSRDEAAIDSPTQGLELVKVSHTLISFDSFISAINQQKQKMIAEGTGTMASFGLNDQFCIVGNAHEKINAVIPLFIHPEHNKRIRILEGLWLGHMFTLDSYGYDKNQEIGLLKLYHQMVLANDGTEWYSNVLDEVRKTVRFIVNESEGFVSAFGKDTLDRFISGPRGRLLANVSDRVIPLMVGLMTDRLKPCLEAVYIDHCCKKLQESIRPGTPEANLLSKRLLYGTKKTTVAKPTVEPSKEDDSPDYVENSFADFLFGSRTNPVQIIPEQSTLTQRRPIVAAELDVVKEMLIDPPDLVARFAAYGGISLEEIVSGLNAERLRKEALVALNFNPVPGHIGLDSIYRVIDERIQGKVSNVITYDTGEESMRIIGYNVARFTDLTAFAGLIRKYAPNKYGPFMDCIVNTLVDPDREVMMRVEKLTSLLTETVGYTPIWGPGCNHPYLFYPMSVERDQLVGVVGEEKLAEIERTHQGKLIIHRYRRSNLPNRHGYSNHNPCPGLSEPFASYKNLESRERFVYVPGMAGKEEVVSVS